MGIEHVRKGRDRDRDQVEMEIEGKYHFEKFEARASDRHHR